MKRALALILAVLVADQALKVWVKLTFFYNSSIELLGPRVQLHFIENRGMAFGMEFGGETGKLLLTLLRIAVVIGIAYGMRNMARQGASRWQMASVSLVFAGALGNIIDSTFYGMLFSQSTEFEKAVFLPPDGGYASIFHGAVVDMFYIPLWDGPLPQWLPFWGGEHFVFFRPVFNIADAAITVGIVLFILSHRRKHGPADSQAEETAGTASEAAAPESSEPAAVQ